MNTCFVIQPFDRDKFDKRYTDIFEPAIKAAGLEPYRIDRDPSVRIPIEEIEEGIKKAKICFAEITLDNPNVWYELGFAFANGKEVVMVTEERQKFPFDIQHRQIVTYKTMSTSDFVALSNSITEKLKALLVKSEKFQLIIDNPVIESDGYKQYEVTMMLIMLENQVTEESSVSSHWLFRNMDLAGFTKAAVNLSTRLLKMKGLIEQRMEYEENDGSEYIAFRLTAKGEKWIFDNIDKIEVRKPKTVKSNGDDASF